MAERTAAVQTVVQNKAGQRAGPVFRVIALSGKPAACVWVEGDRYPSFGELGFELQHEFLYDGFDYPWR